MSTFLYFHIKTGNVDDVCTSLQKLSGINGRATGGWPSDLLQSIIFKEEKNPTYMVLFPNTNGWTTVCHNSFKPLYEWGESLSRQFNTLFIQGSGQNTSDVYHFMMYENGNKRREIYVYHGDDEIKDIGTKFAFEKPVIHNVADDESQCVFFDWDTILDYCRHFGIEKDEEEHDNYIILRAEKGKAVRRAFKEREEVFKRPWWKLW